MADTPHFGIPAEFEHGVPIPDDCIPMFVFLCEKVLEPTRAFAGVPLDITSGYRDEQSNALAHGVSDSEHIATPRRCAADFLPRGRSVREVFDWMRLNPSLPFHQLIYETDSRGEAVIHVSVNLDKPGVRSVLSGATHNAAPYISVDYVPYNPQSTGADEEVT